MPPNLNFVQQKTGFIQYAYYINLKQHLLNLINSFEAVLDLENTNIARRAHKTLFFDFQSPF